jgi:hypothetical protein
LRFLCILCVLSAIYVNDVVVYMHNMS